MDGLFHAGDSDPDAEVSTPSFEKDLILVVDDQESVCQLIARYLARKGYDAITAPGGVEALERVREASPVAIVTDIRMPDMDGMELLANVMATDPDMIVIIATGAPTMDLSIEAMRAGATDFIPKPVDLGRLHESLRRGIHRRKARLASQRQQVVLERRVTRRTAALTKALEELQRVNRQLKEAYEGSIELLRRTSALRDNDTGAHIDRIRLFSGEVAAAMGLPDDEIRLLQAASPMHDIGKIGIPDTILQKPGPLTAEEFAIMKLHTVIGGRILGGYDAPLLCASERIAMTHHECWDGSGYPHGLVGTDIPLFGRIVAAVDMWDALTHVRCYKPAFSTEKSLELMRAGRGTRFEPAVLDAFLTSLPRIVQIEREVRERHSAGATAN